MKSSDKSFKFMILLPFFLSLFLINSGKGEGSGIYVMTLSLFAMILFGIRTKFRYNLTFDKYLLHMVLFLVYCALSRFWSIYPELTVSIINSLLVIFVSYGLLYIFCASFIEIEDVLRTIMWGGYIIIIFGIFYYGLSYIKLLLIDSERISNDFLNANTLGMVSANSIIINVYFLLKDKKFKWWYLFGVPAVLTIAISSSRKALLLALLGIGIQVFFSGLSDNKHKLTSLLKAVGSLSLLLLVLYVLSKTSLFSGINERMGGLIEYFRGGRGDSSTRGRMRLVELGLSLFRQNPILGIGINATRPFTVGIMGTAVYLHNNYVELLAGGGIIGLFLYLSMYFDVIISMIRNWGKSRTFFVIFALCISHLIIEFGYVAYYEKDTWFYFMLFFLELKGIKKCNKEYRLKDVDYE